MPNDPNSLVNAAINRMAAAMDTLVNTVADLKGTVRSFENHLQSITSSVTATNDRVSKTETAIDRHQVMFTDFYGEDGLSGQKKVIRQLCDDMQSLKDNRRDSMTIYKALKWFACFLIGLAAVITAIFYLMQVFVPSAPSKLGMETNSVVKEMRDEMRDKPPPMSLPR